MRLGAAGRWRRRRTAPEDRLDTFAGFGRTAGVWRNPVPFLPAVRRRPAGPLPPAARVEDAFEDPFEEAPAADEARRARRRLPVPPPRSIVAPAVAILGMCAIVAGLAGAFGQKRDPAAIAGSGPAAVAPATPGAARPGVPVPGPATAGPPAGGPREVAVLTQGAAPTTADGLIGAIRGGGWDVTGTARFIGVVPATTVYYPPGQEAAARRLAAQFGIDRVKPSFKGITRNKIAVIVVQRPGAAR